MMRKKSSINKILLALILGVTSVFSPLIPKSVMAAPACDEEFYSLNDILFYNECAESTEQCSTSASSSVFNNKDYLGNEIYNSAQLAAIEENKRFYEAAASQENIPWQLIAVIHGRETGFSRRGPSNGQGPYQITSKTYPIKESYSDEEFQSATYDAAAFIKGKAGDRDLSDPENVKYTLFAYNGMSGAYKQQARNLGFSDDEADRGEGSPYVMNRADARRDPTVEPTKSNQTWGQIKRDHGSIEYPANRDHGAFVQYTSLTNGSLCGSSAVAKNGDANALQAAFTSYMMSHADRYPPLDYYLGYNGCTTLSSWYIGEYTTLVYGRGNGRDVVRNLVNANPGRGLTISDKPVAPAIFSVNGGLRGVWGASGVAPGHVGVVVAVNEQTQTATVVHTGSSKAGKPERAWVSEYKYPMPGVTFVNVGGHLK